MSAVAFFDAARTYKRELTGEVLAGLTDADMDALRAATERRWQRKAPVAGPKGLGNAQAFYKALRSAFGALDQEQVDGFGAVLQAMGVAAWPRSWAAYGLATSWWETARTMQPVKEAYWLSEAWRKANLKKYYPHYGRGYVQLTWPANYERADEELGLRGTLIADLDLALRPDIAAQILVKGMEQGWFTGHDLKRHLPIDGDAGHEAFKQARRIINGTDKWVEIAKIATKFQDALREGQWA